MMSRLRMRRRRLSRVCIRLGDLAAVSINQTGTCYQQPSKSLFECVARISSLAHALYAMSPVDQHRILPNSASIPIRGSQAGNMFPKLPRYHLRPLLPATPPIISHSQPRSFISDAFPTCKTILASYTFTKNWQEFSASLCPPSKAESRLYGPLPTLAGETLGI